MPERLNATELAKYLGVHPSTISHWQQRGLIHSTRNPADRSQKVFVVAEVRRAVIEHNLRVGSVSCLAE